MPKKPLFKSRSDKYLEDPTQGISDFLHLDHLHVCHLPRADEENLLALFQRLKSPRISYLQPLQRPIVRKDKVIWPWPYSREQYYSSLFNAGDSILNRSGTVPSLLELGLQVLTGADSLVETGFSSLLRYCGIVYLDPSQDGSLHRPIIQLVLPPDIALWFKGEGDLSQYFREHTYRFSSETEPHFLSRSLSFYAYQIYRLYSAQKIEVLHQDFRFMPHPRLSVALNDILEKMLGKDGRSELESFSEARLAWAEAMLR